MINTVLQELATAATAALSFPVRPGFNAEAVSKEQIWLTATATPMFAAANGQTLGWNMAITAIAATLGQAATDASGVAEGDATGARRAAMLAAFIAWLQANFASVTVSGYALHGVFDESPQGSQLIGEEYVGDITVISLAIESE